MKSTHTLSLSDRLQVVRNHFLTLFVSITLCAFVGTIDYLQNPAYPARLQMLISNVENRPLHALALKLGAPIEAPASDQERYFLILNSIDFFTYVVRSLMTENKDTSLSIIGTVLKPRLFERFLRQKETNPEELDQGRLAGLLQSMARFEKLDNDGLALNVTTRNPMTTAYLGNYIAQKAIQRIDDEEDRELLAAKSYVEAQLRETQKRIDAIQQEIIGFKTKRSIVSVQGVRDDRVLKVRELRQDLERNQVEYRQNLNLISTIESQRDSWNNSWKNRSLRPDGSVLTRQREALESLQLKRARLVAQGYAQDSNIMQQIDSEIEGLLSEIQTPQSDGENTSAKLNSAPLEGNIKKLSSLRATNQQLKARIDALSELITSTERSLKDLPQEEQTFTDLMQKAEAELAYAKEMKLVSLQIEMKRIAAGHRVKSYEPMLSERISRNTTFRNRLILSSLIGIFFGLLIGFTLEELHPTVKGRSDITTFGYHVLGTIPYVGEHLPKRLLHRIRGIPQISVQDQHAVDSPLTMSFKILRNRLVQTNRHNQKPTKVLTLISSMNEEGKSFCGIHLALSFAQFNRRVLLVDCDVRKPATSRAFKSDNQSGLFEYLSGEKSLDETITHNLVPNMDFISPGRYDDRFGELVTGEKFEAFLNTVKANYDFVLLDTPAMNMIADSISIATMSETLLFVVARGRSKLENVADTLQRLRLVTDKPIYFIVNRAEVKLDYAYINPSSSRPTKESQVA